MKIAEMSPVLYRISYFHYIADKMRDAPFYSDKSHYVYRFLYLVKGKTKICIEGKEEVCCADDIIYLTPGDKYHFVPYDNDFSLYNIFFDFVPYELSEARKTCSGFYISDYDASLCSPVHTFEDAPEFNRSRVFKNTDCTSKFYGLFSTERTDPLYDFYAKSALASAVSQILQNERQHGEKRAGTRNILAYIHHNPDKDLSADTLSKLFSYHKNYINALIKASTGMTLNEYTRHIKVEYAKTLLLEGGLSPTEVSIRLGYYDYSHFYKTFHSETGFSPTAYIRKN